MGLLLAFALILSYIESLLPLSFGIPGIKLGLANLAVLLGICLIAGAVAMGVTMIVTAVRLLTKKSSFTF